MFISYGGAVRVAHTVFSSLCLLITLVYLGETGSAAASLTITAGTCLGAGLIVGHLVGQVRALAGTDSLTGAPNRLAAEQLMSDALARALRSGRPLSLALLDLDGFKQLNDAAGHAAGDQLLRDAVTIWGAQLRDAGSLARLGGDEFLVVLENCGADGAASLVERLVDVTPRPVGCSGGVVRWDGTESSSDLLRRCDAALYRAKAEGGGQVVVSEARNSNPVVPVVPTGTHA